MSEVLIDLPSAAAVRRGCSVWEHHRAAEELRLTQQAVSRTPETLEHDLGVPLIHRAGRRIELTEGKPW